MIVNLHVMPLLLLKYAPLYNEICSVIALDKNWHAQDKFPHIYEVKSEHEQHMLEQLPRDTGSEILQLLLLIFYIYCSNKVD
jgi:hypothetical protein